MSSVTGGPDPGNGATSADRPCVDVVIVTFENEATVARAIASVKGSSLVASTIVVDNASRDGSAEAAEAAGADPVVVNPENRGFAAAVDQALEHEAAEFVLLLNPDAALTEDTLGLLSYALIGHPDAVAAGPVLVDERGVETLGARRFSTPRNRLVPHLPIVRRLVAALGPEYRPDDPVRTAWHPIAVDYLWGAALLLRREFLESCDGLDSRFFLYSEDEDLGLKAQAAGRRMLLVPSARALHRGGASSAGTAPGLPLARQLWAIEILFGKWRGWWTARCFGGAVEASYALQAAGCRVAGRASGAARAEHIRHALRDLRRGAAQ